MLQHIGDAQAQLAAANRGEPRGSGNGRSRGIVCWRNETYVKRWRFGRGVVQILMRCGTSHRVAIPGRWPGELSLSSIASMRADRDQWETMCSNARMQDRKWLYMEAKREDRSVADTRQLPTGFASACVPTTSCRSILRSPSPTRPLCRTSPVLVLLHPLPWVHSL